MRKPTGLLRGGFILFMLIFAAGCTLSGGNADLSGSVKGSAIVKTARTQIGKPYKWGGTSPSDGFDCSGYVYWAFRQNGINVPRNTSEQAKAGVSVAKSALLPGDIVVFSPKWQRGLHTGIYSGSGKFLHSPKTGSHIREDAITNKHWSSTFVSGRRLVH